MSILNYTTKVSAAKTVGEIQEILAKRGVTEMLITFQGSSPQSIMFSYTVNDIQLRYSLPCRWEGVQNVLKNEESRSHFHTQEHARNVGWRILKDWIEAQFAIIDAGLSTVNEVFLPYMLTAQNKRVSEVYNSLLLEDKDNQQ